MERWLPAQGSGIGVLRALPIVLASIIHAQVALGFGGSLSIVPSEPTSTLDAHVQPQDLELRKTVLEFVESGLLSGHNGLSERNGLVERKPPKFRSPKLIAPTVSSKTVPAVPSPKPVVPTPAVQTPTVKQPAGDAVAKTSPFRKWVRPQSKPPTSDTDAANADIAEMDLTAPKVARRSSKSTANKRAQPLLASKSSTAVASDIITADKGIARPIPVSKQPQPSPVSYPESYPDPESRAAANPSSRATKLPPLTRSQQNLRKKVRRVLTHYYNRPLNTRDRSPWELMHAMLAFEAHSKVLQGGPKGEPITAVGWLCFNQACKRRTLMYVNDDSELRVRVGPALQGHRGQLLAMLAQSRINKNYPMLVEDHELKVADLIEMEKQTCYPRTELTFKLIGLMHYLGSDEKWLNDQGQEWGIPRLIKEEIRQPVRGAACGGTHRLSGLTLAYKTREKRGEPVDGQYLKAKKFVTRYQQNAYRLQNRDGSFSTEWFRGPGNEDSLDRKLKTTGHILEWLLYAASEKELKHWRTTKATNYLANIMYNNRYKDWESGPLGHAIHALLVYDRLVFSPYDAPNQSPIAGLHKPVSQSRRAGTGDSSSRRSLH